MIYRTADLADCERIAALHIENWRETYRGAMRDHYLDDEIWEERRQHWHQRFSHPADNQKVILAEAGEKLCGFVCAFGDQHQKYGTLVENLHSHISVRGQGVGKRLLKAAAEWSLQTHLAAGLHLDVLENNRAAQGFYAALGGKHVLSVPWVPPGGGEVIEFKYHWPDIKLLIGGIT